MRYRYRANTLWALRTLAALLRMQDSDLADEALQVGLAYIYTRRRANLATPFVQLAEIWQKLDVDQKEIRALRGTEYPPL